jgi:class 3 adenylate cyclase/TolB-like protein/Tfp pilus assembly protein PilF
MDNEERRLTTILSADVVGYSRLMATDESGTLAQLRAHRKELFEPKTAEYRGRVVKLMGDGTLMEFGSVVDAVLFAVEVQRTIAARNADIPKDRQVVYRIGINIGDIIVVGDDIYGDGVNVAARLQSIAAPGGICIARNVHSQVKVDFGFQHLGEKKLKNMPEPVATYEVWWGEKPAEPSISERRTKRSLVGWPVAAAAVAVVVIGGIAAWTLFPRETAPRIVAASLERMAFPLPEKPSIAVQAFETSKSDGSQKFLAYGLADAIIANLVRTPSLFVIAPQSSLRNRFRGSEPRDIAERFGVKYVLSGSIRGNDDRLTIDAWLIDAIAGQRLWRQTLEGSISDLYRIQNEIVTHVRSTMESNSPTAASGHGGTGFPSHAPHGESYAYLLQGIGHFRNSTPAGNKKAAQLITKAIESDPDNALAHAWKAWSDVFAVMMGWTNAPDELLQRASTSARKSVSLDPSLDFGRWVLGATFMAAGDHANASKQFRRGLNLTPDEPNLLAGAAKSLAFEGAGLEAVEFGNRTLRQSPHPPDWYLWNLGIANYFTEHHDDAIAVLQKAITKNLEANLFLIGSYIQSDRKSDAELHAKEIFQEDPSFHIARYMDRTGFANPNDRRALTADLLAAGLPINVSFPCVLEPTIENCR